MNKRIISAAEYINSIKFFFMTIAMLCFMLITVLPSKSTDVLATEEGNHPITGELNLSAETGTTAGGEVSVPVQESSMDLRKIKISLWQAICITSIICFTFFVILVLGWWKDKEIDKGVMRRAMAGTFVIGFTFLMMLSMWSGYFQKEIILMYIQLVSVVVAFYFGAKVGAETPGVVNGAESLPPAGPPTVKSISPQTGKDEVNATIKGASVLDKTNHLS